MIALDTATVKRLALRDAPAMVSRWSASVESEGIPKPSYSSTKY